MNPFIWILLLIIPLGAEASSSKVRRIYAAKDKIVTVRTAIGIATIIQVPDRPNSVVVGDSESFKVEYLDQAITIKPLHGGAKSNLYIYTDYRRFNVQLLTGPESTSDYVVYLENPREKRTEVKSGTQSGIKWSRISNYLKNQPFTLEVTRAGQSRDGSLIIEFTLRCLKKESFKAEWIWLTQNGVVRPIHSLFLSHLEASSNEPIQGVMQVLKSDIDVRRPLRIEMRRERISYLTLPKVSSWK